MAYTALGVVNLLVSTQNVRYILGRSRYMRGTIISKMHVCIVHKYSNAQNAVAYDCKMHVMPGSNDPRTALPPESLPFRTVPCNTFANQRP